MKKPAKSDSRVEKGPGIGAKLGMIDRRGGEERKLTVKTSYII
jgi:hypothetical protein